MSRRKSGPEVTLAPIREILERRGFTLKSSEANGPFGDVALRLLKDRVAVELVTDRQMPAILAGHRDWPDLELIEVWAAALTQRTLGASISSIDVQAKLLEELLPQMESQLATAPDEVKRALRATHVAWLWARFSDKAE